ncbi:cytochrome P450 [Suillus plorans]|uniref:Cytochrome P450 n=1 Tax=Suillus plorans TaxID=116603 RepID=A0A9P7E2W9_9AGAM|nr:cytochrome P450 [Suillus plorans]KAG1809950.1 cytochrome P450 [Suillus plorans]
MASVIATCTRPDVLEHLLPSMVEDALRTFEMWGNHGTKDISKSLNEIVFTLAARMTMCREFSEDPKKIHALISIFKRLEEGSDHNALIVPWFPTPARFRRMLAGMQLHHMISAVVLSRKDRREDDPLQAMIDKGLSSTKTTVMLATMLFAAIGNTGNVITYLLLHLEANPKWKVLVENEARQLYKDSHTSGCDDGRPLFSMNFIETQMPLFDICISETLRMLFKGPFIRRSVEDMFVDQKHIPRGTYVMFPTADLHYNAAFYSTPQEFNPEHFSAGAIQERRRHGTTFVGWGAGRHMCAGRRAAQMLMKVIFILLLSQFDIQIVTDGGEPVRRVPEQVENQLFKVCPPKQAVTLRYEVRCQ